MMSALAITNTINYISKLLLTCILSKRRNEKEIFFGVENINFPWIRTYSIEIAMNFNWSVIYWWYLLHLKNPENLLIVIKWYYILISNSNFSQETTTSPTQFIDNYKIAMMYILLRYVGIKLSYCLIVNTTGSQKEQIFKILK